MECFLYIRILLDKTINFSFKQTISNFMNQNDLSHVNILLIKSIIELNTLQLISSFFPFMNKSFPFFDITDLSWKILEFFLPDFFILFI